MKRLCITISVLLLAFFSGCRTAQSVQQVRTEYKTITQHDSVWVKETDTVRVFVIGDTVRIYEKQTFFKEYYTIYRDTLRTSDTLRVEKVVQMAGSETPRPVKWWRWFLFGALSAIFIIFAVRIIIKIYLKR